MRHASQRGDKDALKDLKVSWGRLEHEQIISTQCLNALSLTFAQVAMETQRGGEPFTSWQFGEDLEEMSTRTKM